MSPVKPATVVAKKAENELEWDLRGMRGFCQAEALVQDVATRLPFYAPGSGLLVLQWSAVSDGDAGLHVRPRFDLHTCPWLEIPAAAIRPTGAQVEIDEAGGERHLFLRLPARGGRAGSRVPLATGLMRMSMQAHGDRLRFLPVVLRSDLGEDRRGQAMLHLHSLDLAELQARQAVEGPLRKMLANYIAERRFALMTLPGAASAPRGAEDNGALDSALFRI